MSGSLLAMVAYHLVGGERLDGIGGRSLLGPVLVAVLSAVMGKLAGIALGRWKGIRLLEEQRRRARAQDGSVGETTGV